VDQKTGLIISEKSTHKKCYDEALSVVNDWLQNGIPSHRVNAHIYSASAVTPPQQSQKQFDVLSFAADLASGKITDEQASIVFALLSQKFGTSLPVFTAPQVHSVSESTVTGETSVSTAPANIADCRKKTPEELQEELELAKLAESSIGERKLVDFLTEEWTEETSKHLDDKEIHGRKNTKRYCYDMRSNVHAHIKKYFGDELIKNITSKRFNEFLKSMVRNGLSGATVNKTLNCCKVPYDYAFNQHWLGIDLFSGISSFSSRSKERGILTNEEIGKLFNLDWNEKAGKLGNMLAAFSGLRVEEVQAVRTCDIESTVIHVRHGYNTQDRIKDTKNHHTRDVPVVPAISRALKEYAKRNPQYSDLSLVFFSSRDCTIPVDRKFFENSLYRALYRIGISEDQRKERNIVFHSWRHFYATQMVERVRQEQAQQALGHLSPEMTKQYANHKTRQSIEAVESAMNDTYRQIIQFPGDASA
jgi:integrase